MRPVVAPNRRTGMRTMTFARANYDAPLTPALWQ